MGKQTFTLALVERLSTLANIKLTDAQLQKLQQSLAAVEEHMDKLKELDLSQISETTRTSEETNVFRDDSVQASLSQAEALANAKKTHQGYFVVDYLLENKDL
jgi:aspartyl/glutamyl-tRNA(Asn/Gln) amidotransferase C subunit